MEEEIRLYMKGASRVGCCPHASRGARFQSEGHVSSSVFTLEPHNKYLASQNGQLVSHTYRVVSLIDGLAVPTAANTSTRTLDPHPHTAPAPRFTLNAPRMQLISHAMCAACTQYATCSTQHVLTTLQPIHVSSPSMTCTPPISE